ncbi:MAG: hypothetical protein IPH18_09075 [Chitinophagaceae bacterium]|nr:hypothetical protein [Chitinophagaceae bacterium]
MSATFAKRPDNMPIYAMKTSIADCNMSKDDLVEAITRGGVALQEVLSSQLVAEGQMVRRERSFEGVEVNYLSLDTSRKNTVPLLIILLIYSGTLLPSRQILWMHRWKNWIRLQLPKAKKLH